VEGVPSPAPSHPPQTHGEVTASLFLPIPPAIETPRKGKPAQEPRTVIATPGHYSAGKDLALTLTLCPTSTCLLPEPWRHGREGSAASFVLSSLGQIVATFGVPGASTVEGRGKLPGPPRGTLGVGGEIQGTGAKPSSLHPRNGRESAGKPPKLPSLPAPSQGKGLIPAGTATTPRGP
jgi:hypothetical protein